MHRFLKIAVIGFSFMNYAQANTNQESVSSHLKITTSDLKLSTEKKRAFKAPPDILENTMPRGIDSNLLGKITNKYFIRDDILTYIEKSIPATNQRARDAAIRDAQYLREIAFNQDPEQAREYMEWSGNASWCLAAFIGREKSYEITRKIDKFYRDTKYRKAYAEKRDTEIFGWHVFDITTGNLSNKDTEGMNDFCLSGGKYWE